MGISGALLLAFPLVAQTYNGLPSAAFVVESQALPASAHPDREIVLWMECFEKIDNRKNYGRVYTCPEVTTGKGFYRGPTRISLRDTSSGAVINTISLVSPEGGDSFGVPFRIARQPMGPGCSTVPGPLTDGEG